MGINKQQAIEVYELVSNDSYVCEISDAQGNNCEYADGNGSDMITAIEGGNYSEFYLEDADQEEAEEAYKEMVESGRINGEGFDQYQYHRLTVVGGNLMEVAYIPKGGW